MGSRVSANEMIRIDILGGFPDRCNRKRISFPRRTEGKICARRRARPLEPFRSRVRL